MSETRWRMTQADANCSLRPHSLIYRENTGNFREIGRPGPDFGPKKPSLL